MVVPPERKKEVSKKQQILSSFFLPAFIALCNHSLLQSSLLLALVCLLCDPIECLAAVVRGQAFSHELDQTPILSLWRKLILVTECSYLTAGHCLDILTRRIGHRVSKLHTVLLVELLLPAGSDAQPVGTGDLEALLLEPQWDCKQTQVNSGSCCGLDPL